MNKRFLDILSFIMNELQENSLSDLDMQVLYEMLVDEGFTEDEISLAMAWLLNNEDELYTFNVDHKSSRPRPIWRSLNDVEREAISPKAFSFLFHLRDIGILSDDNMENVIDRAVNLRLNAVGVEDMKELIAAVVLDFEASASKGYFQFTSTRALH